MIDNLAEKYPWNGPTEEIMQFYAKKDPRWLAIITYLKCRNKFLPGDIGLWIAFSEEGFVAKTRSIEEMFESQLEMGILGKKNMAILKVGNEFPSPSVSPLIENKID